MTRPKLRMLDPAACARAVVLGAPVRTLGAAPAVKRALDFYGSAAWKKLLREIIAERGRRCEDVNCRTPHRGEGRRIFGDHVVELKDGGAPLDKRNVLLRCAPCHGRKSAAEREARAGREARAAEVAAKRPGGTVADAGKGPSTAGGSSLESAPRPAAFFPTRNRP
jgi:5-methylcytosine-specific restriction enzyme A